MLFTICLLLLPWRLLAQPTITCPPNTVTATDPGVCSAVYNYAVVTTGGNSVNVPFAFTGAVQTWTVPTGVGSIIIEAWGAQGQTNALGVVSGLGGYAIGTKTVIPGQVLNIYVGGGGATTTAGGYNGGGNAGAVGSPSAFGGGGGGATDVRIGGTALTDRVIVAGGGGGAAGNRVNGLGRGTGGGGGGGYFGGGGGAAWPYTSLIVPTGGTQSAGGIGGTSDWTSVANNDGFPGALGIGGNGGDEAVSSQSGSQTASSGGTGGGTTGTIGSYAGTFAGQSGAGGSGYTGTLTSASMTSGLRSGNGQVIISYQVADSIYAIAGFVSGSVFPAGLTTNTLVVSSGGSTDTCSFTLTVNDSTAPTFICPTFDTLSLDNNCVALVPDYVSSIVTTDNCAGVTTESQSITAGTALSGLGSLHPISFQTADVAGNMDSCVFLMVLMDYTAPTLQCPGTFSFTPSTFDCNPAVNFTPPSIVDNCGGTTVTSSHNPGDQFPMGSTTVTYTAMDSVGNSDSCSFVVMVNMPQIDGFVTMTPNVACEGDTITLTADAGFTYLWSTGATTQSILTSVGGSVWVEVTDSAGCTGRDSFAIAFSNPQPVVTPNGASLCTGTFVSYQWFMNGTIIPGATAQCYQPTTDGNFSVLVTNVLGCEGLSDTLGFVGIGDGYARPGFELFPNPAGNTVHLRMEQPLIEQGNITVYDLTGRAVQVQAFAQLQGTVSIDLSRLAKGSYVVKVTTATYEGQRRLMHVE